MAFTRRGLLALSGATALAACHPHRRAAGATLVVGQDPEPLALCTAGSIDAGAAAVSVKLFDRLFNADAQGRPVPMLATGAKTSPDGRTITFDLRPGVLWHDGAPLTSRDVAFSINSFWRVHNARAQLAFAGLQGVETPNDHQVVLHFAEPAPYLASALADGVTQVVPQHIYESGDLVSNPANLKPIGSGPWILQEWVRGEHLTLRRNPQYWNARTGGFDQVVFRFIASGAATVAALETGAIDYAKDNLPLSEFARLQANPKLWARTLVAGHVPTFVGFAFNLERPSLRDPRVRQAFAHAIDKDFIVRNIWLGHAKAADSPIPSYSPWHAAGLPQYAHDPAKAEALLDAAGLRRGADGVRIRLRNEVMPPSPLVARTGQFIKQELAKVGVVLDVRNEGLPAYLKRIFTSREWDTETYSTGSDLDPTIGIERFYSSKSIRVGVPFTNPTHYATPQLDRLLEHARSATDPSLRRKLYAQVQQQVQTDLPMIPLVFPDTYDVGSRRIAIPDLVEVENFIDARPVRG